MNNQEKADLSLVMEKLDEMDQRMAKMEKYLEKQKGFFGGVMLVISCIAWAADQIRDWWMK